MFPDNLTVTINAQAKNLVRIKEQDYSSEYYLREETQDFVLRIRNSQYNDKARGGKSVDRHNVELVNTVFPIAGSLLSTVRKTYVVFENDQGDAVAGISKLMLGFTGFLTEANVLKMTNRES